MKRERPKFLFQDKFLPVLLCGIVINVLMLSNAFSEASNDTKIIFLGNKNIAPVVYQDGTVPSGVAVDIVRALAKHIPQPIEIRAMDWLEAQALVARGEADALIQINLTEERIKKYDFSDPLLESHFSIFTHKDKMGISGLSSLHGLRVGVELGGLPQKLLGKDPQVHVTIIPDFLEGFELLNEGSIDAVVVDYWVGSYILAENNIRNIKVSGEPIQSSYSSIAVKKGNTKLLNEINNALQMIKADGTYQKIIDNWKPKEGVFKTHAQIRERMYSLTILILFVLFLIAVIWMLTLKNELTKRKTAEEKLREQYSTLHSIINSANAHIFSVDRHCRYTSFNTGHAAVMQAIYGAEIKLDHSILEYMTVSEDRETARRNLDRTLAGEQIVEEAYSGDGLPSRQYFQVSHSPIKTETGEVIGVAVLAQDMTNRKQVEEKIRRLNDELEQHVFERTEQLETANKELRSFAYTVSHNLRSPLRHIDGFIALLQKRNAASLDEQSHHYLDTIADSARCMGTLIDDLLSFSRMGQANMTMQPVDLTGLIREVIRELEPETCGRAIRWQIADLPVIKCDRAMLRMALVNLIENAVKFTRSCTQAEIEIGCHPDQDSETVIFVRDNGVGFDMTYVDKLFGVFQRLHRADEFEGTGIGLAIVRRIIERHGGRAWAEGKVDQGATFFFSLPRSIQGV